MNVLFNGATVRRAPAADTAGRSGLARMGAAMIEGLRCQISHGESGDLPVGRAFASEAEATRARMVLTMFMSMTVGSRVV